MVAQARCLHLSHIDTALIQSKHLSQMFLIVAIRSHIISNHIIDEMLTVDQIEEYLTEYSVYYRHFTVYFIFVRNRRISSL